MRKCMKKAYVLIGEFVEDTNVLGVFSSVKKANEAKKWLEENDTYYKENPEELRVIPYEMNGERISQRKRVKIMVFSKELCIERAKEKFPHINDEEALIDYLPDEVFFKTHFAFEEEDCYVVYDEAGRIWCIDKLFAEECIK